MNNMEQEHLFGKGGIKDTPDSRDYPYSRIAGANLPFDWSIGFDIETKVGIIPVKNQYSSLSCGGQAWASYSYALDQTSREEKSAKFIYSQTHIGTGGSDGRTNCNLCVSKGVSSETLCPSYLPDKTTTEAFMTTKGDISVSAYADATTNEELSYWNVSTDIGTVAQALRDNNGVVLGITGQNNGTWISSYPQTPIWGGNNGAGALNQPVWNHWLYAGKTRMVNGKRYIGVLNSWGVSVGENGWQYLSEDYFNSGNIWACWVMLYNTQVKFIFNDNLKLNDRGVDIKMLQTKLGIFADGIFGVKTEQAVKDFQTTNHLKPDGIVGPKTRAVLNQ